MSGRAQRLSASVMTAMPSAAVFSAFTVSWERAVTTIDGAVGGGGKAKSRLATPRVICR